MEALLVPHTHLRFDLARLLLSVFDRVFLLQPTEAPPRGAFRELVEKGHVFLLTPPPLGEKLLWFERLIASYEEWGQMMRWPENVALFRSRPEVLEDTVAEIKAAILGKSPPKEDPVLSARIILQLAQNLDQRLEELDFEYEDLKGYARRLSEFILGQDPTVRRFENWVVEEKEPSWELVKLEERLLAFSRLITLIEQLPTSSLVTDQWEVVENFIDLVPEGQKRGQISITPVSSPEDLQLREEVQKKLFQLLANNGEKPQDVKPPLLEVWHLKASPPSLFKAYLEKGPLEEGRTIIFYLRHA